MGSSVFSLMALACPLPGTEDDGWSRERWNRVSGDARRVFVHHWWEVLVGVQGGFKREGRVCIRMSMQSIFRTNIAMTSLHTQPERQIN
jgi:hypothetical protein